jgi:hypothetical protein
MTTIPYEEALETANPTLALREFVRDLLERGELTRDQIFEALNMARMQLREQGREAGEDLVTEVMDFMVGWCSPRMKL